MSKEIYAYAKVNLFLKVFKKEEDKERHRIYSLFTKVNDFFDIIKICENNQNVDRVKANIKFNKNNFATKVLSILRNNKIIKGYYDIEIQKNIPFYSGLGGVSSCAVALCKYFIAYFDKKLSNKIINDICDSIGFDCYYFFSGFDSAIVSSFGEEIKNVDLKNIVFKNDLILSNIKCSTKKVFTEYNKLNLWNENNDQNMLTSAILKLYPKLNSSYQKNNVFFSGSGSTMVKNSVLKRVDLSYFF